MLDLSKLQTAGIIPQAATWTALAVSYQGQEGDLVALANSYDSLEKYGLQSPFDCSWPRVGRAASGMLDTNTNSLIAVGKPEGASPPRRELELITKAAVTTFALAVSLPGPILDRCGPD